ncbi:MAG TPA: type II toxin-antitoxin system HigB family toxin [Xanthobacteraceae bacterium]|nr:type II toxin-antitoxin system HigB family toxin [Xanthobacteraceae bacterium]
MRHAVGALFVAAGAVGVPVRGRHQFGESLGVAFAEQVARRTLREFVQSLAGHKDQPAVKAALDAWFDEVRKAHWRNTAEVKRSYATASVVSAERIVFNIKGNAYRLVVAVDFEKSIVWIKWLGRHKDYDRIDVATVEHEK